jgi:hypothetical protein
MVGTAIVTTRLSSVVMNRAMLVIANVHSVPWPLCVIVCSSYEDICQEPG